MLLKPIYTHSFSLFTLLISYMYKSIIHKLSLPVILADLHYIENNYKSHLLSSDIVTTDVNGSLPSYCQQEPHNDMCW